MNVYEAIETVYVAAVQPKYAKKEHADALTAVRELLNAYDALAPDWSNAPDDAKWYTIDDEGDCAWHDEEPMLHGGRWYTPHKYTVNGIDIPLGIDWRLCKWSRPEVTA